MLTIVFSCKYTRLMPLFAKQFNKHFSSDRKVIVLTPDKQDYGLPDNFSTFWLPPLSSNWCLDILGFFKDFSDEYFLSCMEDHFLHGPVSTKVMNDAEHLMKVGKIDKFNFQVGGPRGNPQPFYDTWYKRWAPPRLWTPPYVECSEKNNFVSSLQPSVWRTSLFKKFLENGGTAWDFEKKNQQSSWLEQYKVVYLEESEPFPVSDIVRRGKTNKGFWDKLVTNDSDREVFEEANSIIERYLAFHSDLEKLIQFKEYVRSLASNHEDLKLFQERLT